MSADAEGIGVYSATAESMSGEMAAAATSAAGASPALLGPIMGLIGADFTTAYAAAHAGHVASIGQLSAVLSSLGGATAGAATVLTETDLNNAAALKTADLDG
ncbi:type VII secretion target [Nocardia arizonensis]|uniref:type VII secretion target n=1 Tax=Nocardia arizonensis TaxID=1141647 RepID=UPI001EF40677|nr:type VII secretion target [Nocardia arizonensis]